MYDGSSEYDIKKRVRSVRLSALEIGARLADIRKELSNHFNQQVLLFTKENRNQKPYLVTLGQSCGEYGYVSYQDIYRKETLGTEKLPRYIDVRSVLSGEQRIVYFNPEI